ncbi:MAG TPA: DUF6421 family protein [Solirubrobacteraceae bacterium]|nr:DUF6421 family protein [Solirubrobacteraceae bacterium]
MPTRAAGPTRAPIATVLFDEAHGEAWTIRPEIAQAIAPAHPQDSSYELAAQALRARDIAVVAHVDGPLDGAALGRADVLVLAHPSDARWERTVPGGSPVLSGDELDAIEAFVHAGGGLIVLGEEEQDKYASNLNALLDRFGIEIANDAVSDYECHDAAPHWVLAELARAREGGIDLLARVESACFYRAGRLELRNGAYPLARASAGASTPGATLLATTEHGAGRVVVAADSDLFGDDCLAKHDHEDLWCNLVQWTAGGAYRRPAAAPISTASSDPHWAVLRDAVDRLRLCQRADGSIDLQAHAAAALAGEVEQIAAAVAALTPHFPHELEYLHAAIADLRAWAAGGYGTPDFGASLELFRPDLSRQDGIEHLVLFPMLKQNGPRGSAFEALIVRVPWPDWLAELEATRYDNAKFVPVSFVDFTAGYDSECAVLFPETVSVATRPKQHHFGAIFCDREAERFRRTVGAAAQLLKLNLPPDAAGLLTSQPVSEQAFALWDLIHDRAHSRGDLPFDPFMIRKRMPYWMYALEELRCDLTAYGEAVQLERGGFGFARFVQYAMVLDRMLRFPITGERVRNYDGLGGQVLFAFLHRTGRLQWTDNRLTIDWATLPAGIAELRALIDTLYRDGIDRTQLAHWGAAHDLVATYVPSASGSRWVAGARPFGDGDEARATVDLVLDDEFPLSIFFSSLRTAMADALVRPPLR